MGEHSSGHGHGHSTEPGTEHEPGNNHGFDGENDFDARAATWDDDPEKVERARVVAGVIAAAVELRPHLRVLDYGAGTALLAQELAPDVGPLTVADPSSGMREVLTNKVATGVLPEGTRIWDLDLSAGHVPDEEFDLIVSLMALHHIEDVPAVLHGCAALLPPGGRVALADLADEDGSFHDSPDFHGHTGFEPGEFTGWLTDAGFVEVDLHHVHDIAKAGRTYGIFLATATRS